MLNISEYIYRLSLSLESGRSKTIVDAIKRSVGDDKPLIAMLELKESLDSLSSVCGKIISEILKKTTIPYHVIMYADNAVSRVGLKWMHNGRNGDLFVFHENNNVEKIGNSRPAEFTYDNDVFMYYQSTKYGDIGERKVTTIIILTPELEVKT